MVDGKHGLLRVRSWLARGGGTSRPGGAPRVKTSVTFPDEASQTGQPRPTTFLDPQLSPTVPAGYGRTTSSGRLRSPGHVADHRRAVDVIGERTDAANGDWGGAQVRRTLFSDARLTGLISPTLARPQAPSRRTALPIRRSWHHHAKSRWARPLDCPRTRCLASPRRRLPSEWPSRPP